MPNPIKIRSHCEGFSPWQSHKAAHCLSSLTSNGINDRGIPTSGNNKVICNALLGMTAGLVSRSLELFRALGTDCLDLDLVARLML